MRRMWWLVAGLLPLMISSCSTLKSSQPVLRVGMTPNYPPLAMLRDGFAAGVECDFATQLAADLGMELELISVPWEKQLDELGAGKIDIVMSGMTVTMPRQARAAFCDPYMSNPLIAVTRRGESGKFPTAGAIQDTMGGIGMLKDTSADTFVRRHFRSGKILPLARRDDVVFYLANQRIDLFVDDLAAAIDVVSRNEAKLELIPIPLEEQKLAWAVRPEDAEFRGKVNAVLERWRANGVLDQILNQWLPYRPALQARMPL